MEFWALLFPQISPEPCFWEKTGVGPSCFIHERDSQEVAVGLEEYWRRVSRCLPESSCVTLGVGISP